MKTLPTAKEKGPAGGNRGALSKNAKPQFSAASSATEVQERRIIAALRIRPRTTDDFRKLGIFQISARIFGLRCKGFDIVTTRVTVVDRDGFAHPRAALYSLVGEPEARAATANAIARACR